MKKGKIFIVGLIGLLMAGGLVLGGCEEESGCSGDGGCYYGTSLSQPYKWCGEGGCSVLTQDNSTCNC